jgi:hypothetical protein
MKAAARPLLSRARACASMAAAVGWVRRKLQLLQLIGGGPPVALWVGLTDAAAGQPGPESGLAVEVPGAPGVKADKGEPGITPVDHVPDRLGLGRGVVDVRHALLTAAGRRGSRVKCNRNRDIIDADDVR